MKKRVYPEEKRCPRCKEIKPIEEFHFLEKTQRYVCYCRQCVTEMSFLDNININGGRVLDKPNHYSSNTQRQYVAEIMTALGWSFNEKNKIWYKKGLKSKNGNWKK